MLSLCTNIGLLISIIGISCDYFNRRNFINNFINNGMENYNKKNNIRKKIYHGILKIKTQPNICHDGETPQDHNSRINYVLTNYDQPVAYHKEIYKIIFHKKTKENYLWPGQHFFLNETKYHLDTNISFIERQPILKIDHIEPSLLFNNVPIFITNESKFFCTNREQYFDNEYLVKTKYIPNNSRLAIFSAIDKSNGQIKYVPEFIGSNQNVINEIAWKYYYVSNKLTYIMIAMLNMSLFIKLFLFL